MAIKTVLATTPTTATISVSGDTVSYNAFTGSHWSRLLDNSKPTILKGTVLETIDAMCDWYELEFTNAAGTPKIEEIVLDEETQKISATDIREKMREEGKL